MTEASARPHARGTLGLAGLTGLVVGSMVGAGVFSLPSAFADATGGYGALIAWGIAGIGTLALALVFQRLATERPDLDAGIFAYAKAGFGDYVGFLSAFGYWAGACVANVTYWVLVFATVGQVVPAFGDGATWWAIGAGTAGIWLFHILVARGVNRATIVNSAVAIAKVVPLAVFLIVVLVAGFDWDVFTANLWGGGAHEPSAIVEQVRSTMLLIVFAFLGLEGASVYSRLAARRRDIGRATVLGFLGVLALFVLVTMLSYGVLPRDELAALDQPSVGGVLEAVVGSWGAWLVGIGLLISVLGAYLAWTLMATEVLRRVSARGVPIAALLATSVLTQVFLVTARLAENAFEYTLALTSSLTLIPYLLTAGFGVRSAVRLERRAKALAIGASALVYTVFLVWAAGPEYALVSAVIYAPATIVYAWARRQHGAHVFTRGEWAVFAVAVGLAVTGVVALATGAITI